MERHETMNKIHFALVMKKLNRVWLHLEDEFKAEYIADVTNHHGFKVFSPSMPWPLDNFIAFCWDHNGMSHLI